MPGCGVPPRLLEEGLVVIEAHHGLLLELRGKEADAWISDQVARHRFTRCVNTLS